MASSMKMASHETQRPCQATINRLLGRWTARTPGKPQIGLWIIHRLLVRAMNRRRLDRGKALGDVGPGELRVLDVLGRLHLPRVPIQEGVLLSLRPGVSGVDLP